jgi:hypothetical protein
MDGNLEMNICSVSSVGLKSGVAKNMRKGLVNRPSKVGLSTA